MSPPLGRSPLPATRQQCAAADAADPLAALRERFVLPPGVIYLDGNSLGPLPRGVAERIEGVVRFQWGESLIRGWNDHGWIGLPARVAERLAPLLGASPEELAVGDGTTVDLFKALAAALELRRERRVVLSVRGNFPSDLYVAEGLLAWLGRGHRLRCVPAGRLAAALDEEVAVVTASHVDFRSGELLPLASLTARAREVGALSVWDVSHSAGTMPLELASWGVDFAVGCGYKFLNGGPGAPAFLFVRRGLGRRAESPLRGWLGHREPFAFVSGWRPAAAAGRFMVGTPAILSLAALAAALEAFDGVDLRALRGKGEALAELFVSRVEAACGDDVALASPREAARRGSQVALRHPEGRAIVQALAARGVLADFRAPDVLRFGLAPLYLRFVDVWDAVEGLREVLTNREWERPENRIRLAVT